MNVLVDGLTHDFAKEREKSCLPLYAVFQLVDDFQLTGLFDVILETMKQAPVFFQFYYEGFEDVASLILARVGMGHLEELKEVMKTDSFVSELYPLIFNAVVQMAVENPSCRQKVLAWASDVFKDIYKKYNVPPMLIMNGIKGVTKLLSEGTDEKVVPVENFKEMLEYILEGEKSGFNPFAAWEDFKGEDDFLKFDDFPLRRICQLPVNDGYMKRIKV